MRVGGLLVAIAIAGAVAGDAQAAPRAPCAGCTLDLPAHVDGPVPIVVLLHGDRQRATTIASWWRKAVLARGWALLSLQCPTALGCVDSYWQWDGDPAWVAAQVAALDVAVDPKRMYLVGWSGGASYIGSDLPAWAPTFAAIVIHGGGIAPRDATCPAVLPAYFLVGDRNPLHRHARELRDAVDACKQEVVWDLVRGGDHDREERALTPAKQATILDWLAGHART